MKFSQYLALLFISALLSACTSTSDIKEENFPEQNEEELYQAGYKSLQAGNYSSAVKRLEAVEARFPFGAYSQQAQLDLINAYHHAGNKESAIATADRFIRQNPRHEHVAYAYYMKGLVYFPNENSFIEGLVSAKLHERDAESLRKSFENFAELLRLFPDTKYAKDARQRMVYLRNKLADHELHVARYYMSREAYMAAANRAKYVVEHYPKTHAIPYALDLMKTAYELLGLDDMAEETRRVLLLNHPGFSS